MQHTNNKGLKTCLKAAHRLLNRRVPTMGYTLGDNEETDTYLAMETDAGGHLNIVPQTLRGSRIGVRGRFYIGTEETASWLLDNDFTPPTIKTPVEFGAGGCLDLGEEHVALYRFEERPYSERGDPKMPPHLSPAIIKHTEIFDRPHTYMIRMSGLQWGRLATATRTERYMDLTVLSDGVAYWCTENTDNPYTIKLPSVQKDTPGMALFNRSLAMLPHAPRTKRAEVVLRWSPRDMMASMQVIYNHNNNGDHMDYVIGGMRRVVGA